MVRVCFMAYETLRGSYSVGFISLETYECLGTILEFRLGLTNVVTYTHKHGLYKNS
jgi:hypothetical protein